VWDSKCLGDYSRLRPTQTLGAAFGTARASGVSLSQFGWWAQLQTAFQGGLYPFKRRHIVTFLPSCIQSHICERFKFSSCNLKITQQEHCEVQGLFDKYADKIYCRVLCNVMQTILVLSVVTTDHQRPRHTQAALHNSD